MDALIGQDMKNWGSPAFLEELDDLKVDYASSRRALLEAAMRQLVHSAVTNQEKKHSAFPNYVFPKFGLSLDEVQTSCLALLESDNRNLRKLAAKYVIPPKATTGIHEYDFSTHINNLNDAAVSERDKEALIWFMLYREPLNALTSMLDVMQLSPARKTELSQLCSLLEEHDPAAATGPIDGRVGESVYKASFDSLRASSEWWCRLAAVCLAAYYSSMIKDPMDALEILAADSNSWVSQEAAAQIIRLPRMRPWKGPNVGYD